MDINAAFEMIKTMIETTNNGKLLRYNVPRDAREFIPELLAAGKLGRATFMNCGDAIILK